MQLLNSGLSFKWKQIFSDCLLFNQVSFPFEIFLWCMNLKSLWIVWSHYNWHKFRLSGLHRLWTSTKDLNQQNLKVLSQNWKLTAVTDRTFGLAELLLCGLAQMTELFSTEHRTLFCITFNANGIHPFRSLGKIKSTDSLLLSSGL